MSPGIAKLFQPLEVLGVNFDLQLIFGEPWKQNSIHGGWLIGTLFLLIFWWNKKGSFVVPLPKINRPELFFVAYRISNCTKTKSSNSSTKMLAITSFYYNPLLWTLDILILSSPRHLFMFAQVTMQFAALLPVVENDRGKKHPSWSHHRTGSRRANDFVPGSAWHFWTSVRDGLGLYTMRICS